MKDNPTPQKSERSNASGFTEQIVLHLADISVGRFALTESEITQHHTDPDVAELLTGLLCLHEDLMYERMRQQRATSQLREVNRRYLEIIERSIDGICIVATNNIVLFANRKAADYLSMTTDELLQKKFPLLPLTLGSQQIPIHLPGDQSGVGTLTVEPLTWENQPALQVVIRDDTEAYRLRDEQTQMTTRLRQAHRLEAMGRLAGGVAHDFNNMLTIIMNFAYFIGKTLPEADPRWNDVNGIQNAAKRAKTLTSQLLTFSRGQTFAPKPINVAELLTDVQSILQRLLRADIELSIDVQPDVWPVFVDASLLEQVIINLAINARDAMLNGGRLTISAMRADAALVTQQGLTGDYTFVSVRDTGVGMAPDVVERAFEPFFTTKETGKGTGLGLATAYGIITQAAGLILLESEENHGTTVTMLLPRSTAPQPDAQQAEKPVASDQRKRTILLVEDEAIVRSLTARMLREEGYTVHETANGREALEQFRQRRSEIDLVLTDVVMPKMGGIALATEIAQVDEHLPIVFVTGYSDKLPHPAAAAERVLSKPFTAEALIEMIEKVGGTD